ncbi:hypothetical protein NUW58_g4 [Xylaria curta]|uniref:Uncharacterized protein n=1 Tax=Xylaria curta TaxID=42375 RepID=A0ACC1PSF6_9PEZI|nr:hypothetical protein NUW58_g4 [Xylaria curta]
MRDLAPVHAFSVMLGKRTGYAKSAGLPYRPHNVTHIVLGTVFLWVGWFGFNGGSAFAANLRAVMACIVTHLSASVGGITWVLLDYRLEKKWSVVGFCSGAISGLVAITPASGYVTPWAAVIFGRRRWNWLQRRHQAEVPHGDYIAALDGFSVIPGGWINHNYIQLAYQIADSVAGFAYSFVLTCVILFLLNLIPGLSLRVSPEEEDIGIDDIQLGEFAYDYVELQRHTSDIIVAQSDHERASSSKGSVPEKSAEAMA